LFFVVVVVVLFGRSHKNSAKCRAQFFHQFYLRVVRKSKRNNNQKEEKKKNWGRQNNKTKNCEDLNSSHLIQV